MIDPGKTLEKLAKLGTADRIAAYLVDNNITGKRTSACNCPIAALLKQRTNTIFEVYSRTITVSPDNETPDPLLRYWPVPKPVGEFVVRFDYGDYPELESRNA